MAESIQHKLNRIRPAARVQIVWLSSARSAGDMREVPGKPGVCRAIVFLRPHFQQEELTMSIRLVAELPPLAAA